MNYYMQVFLTKAYIFGDDGQNLDGYMLRPDYICDKDSSYLPADGGSCKKRLFVEHAILDRS